MAEKEDRGSGARRHKILKNQVRLHLGKIPWVAIFNNESGVAKFPRPGGGKCTGCHAEKSFYTVKYGVGSGGSDLIGIVRNEDGVGVFVGLEVKTGRATLDKHQKQFEALCRNMGGYAQVIRSVAEAEEFVNRVRRESCTGLESVGVAEHIGRNGL